MHKEKKNTLVFWILSIVGILLLTWGMVSLARNNDNNPGNINTEVKINDQVKGNPDAALTIIEYSDFQCPACSTYYALVNQLVEELGDQVKVIYRHFPLDSIHPYAETAAQVAEAAGLQNKFWEMHDLLFENQEIWSASRNPDQTFLDFATQLELDLEKFQSDLDSDAVKDKIKQDVRSANQAKVNSTPSFFVNGTKISNPRSYNQFKNDILQFQNQ
jgi:protein-disulfide isomerase